MNILMMSSASHPDDSMLMEYNAHHFQGMLVWMRLMLVPFASAA